LGGVMTAPVIEPYVIPVPGKTDGNCRPDSFAGPGHQGYSAITFFTYIVRVYMFNR